MKVGELARRTGATIRALRYYEKLGLVVPSRLPNGYRDYDRAALAQVAEIRTLIGLGLSVEATRPFLDCLACGHDEGDECPASLAGYRHAIDDLSARIDALAQRRDTLAAHLEAAALRSMPQAAKSATPGFARAPEAPALDGDDGVEYLTGTRLPPLSLQATDGSMVRLDALGPGRTVLYLYPLTGSPKVDLPEGWDVIPGARGCTQEARGFRDHHAELRAAGAVRVYGLSSQAREYQREVAGRLRLPFAMLSDQALRLRGLLGLPAFTAGGMSFYQRLTMIINHDIIEHVFYPVPVPDRHPAEVLGWLRSHPSSENEGA